MTHNITESHGNIKGCFFLLLQASPKSQLQIPAETFNQNTAIKRAQFIYLSHSHLFVGVRSEVGGVGEVLGAQISDSGANQLNPCMVYELPNVGVSILTLLR